MIGYTVDELLEWFHEHYVDAVHGFFFDNREGGYQLVPGTIEIDPIDVLRSEFSDADATDLEEAASILCSEGGVWVSRRDHPII